MRVTGRRRSRTAAFVFGCYFLQTLLMSLHPALAAPVLLSGYPDMSDEDRSFVDQMVASCSDPARSELVTLTPEQRRFAPRGQADFTKVIIRISEGPGAPEQILDCEAVGIGPVHTGKYKALRTDQAASCSPGDWTSQFRQVARIGQDLHYAAELQRCESQGGKLLSTECLKDLGCNLARSVMYGALPWLMSVAGGAVKADSKACLSPSNNNCLSQLVQGFFEDLWGIVEGLVGAVKWVGKKTAEGLQSIAEFFGSESVSRLEDQSTKKLLAASATSEKQKESFLKDPWGFIKSSLQDFTQWILNASQPLARGANVAWKCASCNDLLNGACKIAGILGGEIFAAYMTGGAINLLGKAAKGTEIAAVFSALGKSAAGGLKAVSEWKLARALAGAGRAVLYVPGKIMQGAARLPGVKPFISASEEAFMRGYLGKTGFAQYQAAQKVEQVLSRVQKVRKTSLTAQERAYILEHPEVSWEKLKTPEALDQALAAARTPQTATHTESLSAISHAAERDPITARLESQMQISTENGKVAQYLSASSSMPLTRSALERSSAKKADELLAASGRAEFQTQPVRLKVDGRWLDGELVIPDASQKGLSRVAAGMETKLGQSRLVYSKSLNESYDARALFGGESVEVYDLNGKRIQGPVLSMSSETFQTGRIQSVDVHELVHAKQFDGARRGGDPTLRQVMRSQTRLPGMSDGAYGTYLVSEEIKTHAVHVLKDLSPQGNRVVLEGFKARSTQPFSRIVQDEKVTQGLDRLQDLSNATQTNLKISKGTLEKLSANETQKLVSQGGQVSLSPPRGEGPSHLTVKYKGHSTTVPLNGKNVQELGSQYQALSRAADLESEIARLAKYPNDPEAVAEAIELRSQLARVPPPPPGMTREKALEQIEAQYSKAAVEEARSQLARDMEIAQRVKLEAGNAKRILDEMRKKGDLTEKDYLRLRDQMSRPSAEVRRIRVREAAVDGPP